MTSACCADPVSTPDATRTTTPTTTPTFNPSPAFNPASNPASGPASDAATRPSAVPWAAVASLTLGVFGLVTAEFLPVSLLTAMAGDLGLSAAVTGQSITATALVAAVVAPLLPVVTGNLDRRRVMLALMALLVVSNVIAATAGGAVALFTARILLGIALGGFWSMVGALTLRLVPPAAFPRAMAVVLTGVSVATVCAAPIGAWLGELFGWRSAFIAAGVLSIVTLLGQAVALPALPPRDRPDLKALAGLLTRPAVQVALAAVLLVISGHFAGFTYVRPLMENVARLSIGAISTVLLGYGIGGFIGNLVGGLLVQRSERLAIAAGGAVIVALAASLLLAGQSGTVTAVAIVLWGFAFGAFPVGFQAWILRAAPDQTEAAGGLLVAAFQIAIASGAIGGGLLVDRIGALGAPLFAVVAMALGTILTVTLGPRPAVTTAR